MILLSFALLSCLAFTFYRVYTPWCLTHDQIYLGTFDAREEDPGLFKRDYLFRTDSFYRYYLPVFRQLLSFLRELTGSFEIGLWVLVPLLVAVYAWGWGLLLWRLTQSLWITLLFTFLALPYRPAPLGEFWGVAGVEGMVARTLVTAISPYLFLLIFSGLQRPRYWQGLLFGGLAGLAAYIHPLTSLSLVGLAAALWLLLQGRCPRTWGLVALMLVVFGAMATYPGLLREQQAWAPGVGISFEEFRQAVSLIFKVPTQLFSLAKQNHLTRHLALFLIVLLLTGTNYFISSEGEKPRALLYFWLGMGLTVVYLGWRIVGKGAGLSWLYATLAAYIILVFGRRQIERLDWWLLAWGVVTLLLYLVPSFCLTWLWLNVESIFLTTWVVEYRRVARLLHPFSYMMGARAAVLLIPWLSQTLRQRGTVVAGEYILLTLGMFNQLIFRAVFLGVLSWEVLRLWPRYRPWLMAGGLLVLLLGGWQLSLQRSLPDWQEFFAPIAPFRQYSPTEQQAEEELANWAREHTPKEALFYHDSPLFRYLSRRSITHAYPTSGETGNYRTTAMVELYLRSLRLEAALQNPETLAREARLLQADYIVTDKLKSARLRFPLVYENDKYLVYQNVIPGNPKGAHLPRNYERRPFGNSNK